MALSPGYGGGCFLAKLLIFKLDEDRPQGNDLQDSVCLFFAALKHHFFAAAQFFFDSLDHDIQVMGIFDEVKICRMDG